MADHLSSPEALLAWLGESQSADEVADKLRSLGVKGEPTEPETCPIAVAIGLTGAYHPTVWPDVLEEQWAASWEEEERDRKVLLADVLAAFADNFDCDEYPDLIEAS